MKTGKTQALALPDDKQWVIHGRAVNQIILVDTDGVVQYESVVPWLPATVLSRKIDVVGLRSLRAPVVLDYLDQVDRFVPMRPILVRGPVEDVDDDRTDMWCTTNLYLPLTHDQLSYSGSRWEGNDRFDEFLVTVSAIAELARSNDQNRFVVDKFTISRWVRG